MCQRKGSATNSWILSSFPLGCAGGFRCAYSLVLCRDADLVIRFIFSKTVLELDEKRSDPPSWHFVALMHVKQLFIEKQFLALELGFNCFRVKRRLNSFNNVVALDVECYQLYSQFHLDITGATSNSN